jgi:hypothetical protein
LAVAVAVAALGAHVPAVVAASAVDARLVVVVAFAVDAK